MSYSLLFPSQWDDFESMFDKLVTDRYGPAPNPAISSKPSDGSGLTNGSKPIEKYQGSSLVSRFQRPKMDIVETEEAFILTTELPGAKKGKRLSQLYNIL